MYEDNIYDTSLKKITPKYGNYSTIFLKWYLNIQFVHDELDTWYKHNNFPLTKWRKNINPVHKDLLKWYNNVHLNQPFRRGILLRITEDNMAKRRKSLDEELIFKSRYNQVVLQYKQLLIIGRYYDNKAKYHESYSLGDPLNEFNWRKNGITPNPCESCIFSLINYDRDCEEGNEPVMELLPRNYWYSSPKKIDGNRLNDLVKWREKINAVNEEYILETKSKNFSVNLHHEELRTMIRSKITF
jgi:hypothetical protein